MSMYGFQQAASGNWCGAGVMDRRSAEQALAGAQEAAHRAITHAAYLAGAAGLDYSAPAGFPVDLQNVPKASVCNPIQAWASAASRTPPSACKAGIYLDWVIVMRRA